VTGASGSWLTTSWPPGRPAARPWSQGDDPFFVSVRGADADEITGYWTKLVEGSTVVQPLAPAPWVPLYGMLTGQPQPCLVRVKLKKQPVQDMVEVGDPPTAFAVPPAGFEPATHGLGNRDRDHARTSEDERVSVDSTLHSISAMQRKDSVARPAAFDQATSARGRAAFIWPGPSCPESSVRQRPLMKSSLLSQHGVDPRVTVVFISLKRTDVRGYQGFHAEP